MAGDGSRWGLCWKEAWASAQNLREWEAGGLRIGPDQPPCPLGSDILYPKDSSSPHSGVPAEVLCRGRDFVVSAQALWPPGGGWGARGVDGGCTVSRTLAQAAGKGQERGARWGGGE